MFLTEFMAITFNSVLVAIEIVLFVIVAVQVAYLLVFSLFSLGKYKPMLQEGPRHRFAVMVPGYKEDQIILETAKVTLEQDYPKNLYRVLVLADQFKKETVDDLRDQGAEVL